VSLTPNFFGRAYGIFYVKITPLIWLAIPVTLTYYISTYIGTNSLHAEIMASYGTQGTDVCHRLSVLCWVVSLSRGL
jgi:hypothetical protein